MDATGSAFHLSFRRRVAAFVFILVVLAGSIGPSVNAAAQTTLYGPFSDGCYYLWDGVQYIEGQCPQADGSTDFYVPSANGWQFAMRAIPLMGGGGIVYFADGTRVDLASDGSITIYGTNGIYGRWASDGTLVETGYLDSRGVMIQTSGRSRGTLYPQVPMNISGSSIFGALNAANDLNSYNSCLQNNSTYTDYDNDYNTGLSELIEYCRG